MTWKYFPPKFIYYFVFNVLLAVYLYSRTSSVWFAPTLMDQVIVAAINVLLSIALTALPFMTLLVLEIIFSKDHSATELVFFIIFCLLVIGLIRFVPSRHIYRYVQCLTEGCDNQRLYEE